MTGNPRSDAPRNAPVNRSRMPLLMVTACLTAMLTQGGTATGNVRNVEPSVDVTRSILSCVELSPAWLYALALYHGGAPSELYRRQLEEIPSEVLLHRLSMADGKSGRERFLTAAAAEFVGRTDIDPGPALMALPEAPRLTLANALGRAGHRECVPLYRSLLTPLEGRDREGWAPALAGLGFYYRRTRQYRLAAELFLSAERYTASPFVISDYMLEAARIYRTRLHEPARAQQLYAEFSAERSDSGWIAGAAVLDQARSLYARGEFSEAKRLLSGQITGHRAAEVRVALELLKGKIAWAEGRRKAAREHTARVVTLCSRLDTERPEVAAWRTEAEEAMELLAADPPQVLAPVKPAPVVLKPEWNGALRGSTELAAVREVDGLEAVAAPGVEVKIGGWYRRGFLFRTRLTVTVSDSDTPLPPSGSVTVRCPEFTGGVSVPLIVRL